MFKSTFPYRVVKLVHHSDGSIERVMVERCQTKRMAFNDRNYLRRSDPIHQYDIDILVAAEGVREIWEAWSQEAENKIVKNTWEEEE